MRTCKKGIVEMVACNEKMCCNVTLILKSENKVPYNLSPSSETHFLLTNTGKSHLSVTLSIRNYLTSITKKLEIHLTIFQFMTGLAFCQNKRKNQNYMLNKGINAEKFSFDFWHVQWATSHLVSWQLMYHFGYKVGRNIKSSFLCRLNFIWRSNNDNDFDL